MVISICLNPLRLCQDWNHRGRGREKRFFAQYNIDGAFIKVVFACFLAKAGLGDFWGFLVL